MSVGAAAALVLTLAAPTATADTSGPEPLGSASDLGVDVPETTPELSSEFATSRTGAWFVELEEEPVTRGGDLRIMAQARRDITTEARSAGVDLDVRQTFTRLWNGISANIDDEDIDVIRDLDQVKAVYPVLPIDAPQTPVSDKDLVYALSMSGADIAQSELGYTGEGLKVGIIDTGVDYDHPDLGGAGVDGETSFPTDKVVAGSDFVGDDYNADPEDPAYQPVPMPDPDPDDCHGHGTHVAGIVAADGDVDAGGVRGVAPGAQLGAYRVFGCDGSTEADIMAAAMEQALVDGMDVVNMSIGSAFSTFPQYPTAVAADNLVDAGVVVVASIGNSGTEGTWSAGAPGVGEKVIGVASFDNVAVKAAVFEVDGEQVPYMPASGSPAPPTEGSVPLARLGAPGTAESTACAPIEADLSGQAVLIERGAHASTPDCDATFYAKALAAQDAGAAAVVLYNNVPGLFAASVAGAEQITIPVVSVDREAGLALDATVADDGATLTWTDEIIDAANPTAGLISSFSSYGLTAELDLKPDIGAPGGNIYSTYPLEQGGHAVNSGTSMSSPHVAGAVALLLEARPDVGTEEVRDVLQNSADPADWSLIPGAGYLEPVHRQGAGMLDIDDAIQATTTVTPGKLALGESEGGPVTRELTLTNDGDEDVIYTLSSVDTIATADDPADPGFYLTESEVVMPDEVTVPAGGSATVEVTIAPEEGMDELLAQYGGYIVLTPEEGEPLSVPFAGFAGDYQSLPLLENLGDIALPALGKLTGCDRLIEIDCVAGGSWDLVEKDEVFTLQDGDVPTVLVHLEHPAQSLTFTIFRPMPEGPGVRPQAVTDGQAIARYVEYVGRDAGTDFTAWTWDGTRSNADGSRSDVPDGRYTLEIRALSPLGDPDNRDHVQIASTVPFIIDRDGDGEIPPIEPEEPEEPTPPAQRHGFFLNDGWDGVPEHVFQYGRHTDEVLIGDWDGDGRDTITVRRGNRYFVNNAARGGPADSVFTYGRADDVVLVGDWDGDGRDTLAVRRGKTYHVKNSLRGGEADHVVQYGRAGDVVLVGDWDGDGRDTFAVRRGATYHVRNAMRGGQADAVLTYGRAEDDVIAGDWDGDGRDTLAVRRGKAYHVKNSLRGGPADFSVFFGRAEDEVLVGDWDGDGKDTLGVRRTP